MILHYLFTRAGFKDTKLEAKDKKKKKSEAKDRLSEDRPSGGQVRKCSRTKTQRAGVLKKGVLPNVSRNFRRRKKKVMTISSFLTTQKILLSSTEDRAFSRTCRLQGLDLRGQGLPKFVLEAKDVDP